MDNIGEVCLDMGVWLHQALTLPGQDKLKKHHRTARVEDVIVTQDTSK